MNMKDNTFWPKFVTNSRSILDFNVLFRKFHQSCALPDKEGLHDICEANLAAAVSASVERIHFHGLDLEMANLTVEQPSMKVLKVEIHHGLVRDRASNGPADSYVTQETSILGAPATYYVSKENDTRSFFDFLDDDHRPYLVAVTAMIESPMKLYVQNQNFYVANRQFVSNHSTPLHVLE